jgi:4'-phosphopantetheinyl transferase EntD
MIAGVIEQILPDNVAVEDTTEDRLDIELFPAEVQSLGGAVEKRRREFITGRACARGALAQLGMGPVAIPSGERGEPCWPVGIVGSITHCAGYRACALARAGEIAALGIDAEPNEALPRGVLGEIAGAQESAQLEELLRSEPAVRWDRLLFSTKEAVYKVWFPLARSWLGFEEVVVTIDRAARAFDVRLLVGDRRGSGQLLPRAMRGHWLVRDGLVLTALALSTRS